MSEQRPTDLSDLPQMIPERDDLVHRQPPPPTSPARQASVRLWPLYSLILLLLMAVGYLGFEGWQLQQQLTANANDAQTRLEVLEGQLSATDESLSLNASAIQANFSNIGAEIRRLWDVADTRNRDWIRENQAALAEIQPQMARLQGVADQTAAQGEQLLALQNTVQGALGQSQAAEAGLAELKSQLDSLSAANDFSARLELLEVQLASRSSQISSTQDRLDELVAEFASTQSELSQSLNALSNRVNQVDNVTNNTELEQLLERVEALNISRSDTIQRLSSLQSQIRALRDEVEALQSQ